MLSETHLAIIRAALKYLDEEMSPHGNAILQNYLHRQDSGIDVVAGDIPVTRAIMEQAELFHALQNLQTGLLSSTRLTPASVATELVWHSDQSRLVSVLIADTSAR